MSQTDYDAAMIALEHWKTKATAAEEKLRALDRFGIQTDVSPYVGDPYIGPSMTNQRPPVDISPPAETAIQTTIVTTDSTTKAGVKFDAEKPRLDLVPPEAVLALGEVLTGGAKKYGDRNWEKGLAFGRVYAATMRHLLSWWHGEDLDPESGLNHLKHAMCNVAFLVAYAARGVGADDRPRKETK